MIEIPLINLQHSWSYKHSKLKLGVRVMEYELRVGTVGATV